MCSIQLQYKVLHLQVLLTSGILVLSDLTTMDFLFLLYFDVCPVGLRKQKGLRRGLGRCVQILKSGFVTTHTGRIAFSVILALSDLVIFRRGVLLVVAL